MINEPDDELAVVWQVMTELYLDQEFGKSDACRVAEILSNTTYSDSELLNILLTDVHPVFWGNLATTAGEWMGFDKQAVVSSILQYKSQSSEPSNKKDERGFFGWLKRRRLEVLEASNAERMQGVTSVILKEWSMVQSEISEIRKTRTKPSANETAA